MRCPARSALLSTVTMEELRQGRWVAVWCFRRGLMSHGMGVRGWFGVFDHVDRRIERPSCCVGTVNVLRYQATPEGKIQVTGS